MHRLIATLAAAAALAGGVLVAAPDAARASGLCTLPGSAAPASARQACRTAEQGVNTAFATCEDRVRPLMPVRPLGAPC